MTVVGRSFEELKSELVKNGCEIVCADFFSEHDRIVCKKDKLSFVLQFKRFYTYHFVIKLFTDLGITPPEDCLHVKRQDEEMIKRYNEQKGK